MDLLHALRTNAAVREFADEPITDEVLGKLLDTARFAPSGGNRQPWRVAVIRDAALRRSLADLCSPVWSEYVAMGSTGHTPFNVVDAPDEVPDLGPQANPLLDRVEQVPAVLVVAADLALVAMMDKDLDRVPLTGGASVYPFVYSLLLAARDAGLGGVMTTFLARAEREASGLLGLPDSWAVASMVFLGRPKGDPPTKLTRKPVVSFTTVDRFDGPAFA
ncbi:MAG: nitroreductase family protein [Actinomycetota bacterium]|nr:nitroreductase family protein [Actinomycetota bacterium]